MSKRFLFLMYLFVASDVFAQTVTLNQHQATLKNLFVDIHRQTGLFFVYSDEDLAQTNLVDIQVTQAPIEKALDICFAGQPLNYKIDRQTILVQKKTLPTDLFEINGVIVGEEGDPILGASVRIQGTETYTETDESGGFHFSSVSPQGALLISHVGYESLRIFVAGKNALRIVLKRSLSKLDEVQVIGYGTTTHRLNTGSVSTLKSEDIDKQPITDPLSALEGRVAGLNVIQNSGVTGSSFQVLIRGRNSLTSGTNPLYIVDGVPFPSSPMGSVYSGIIQSGDPLSSIDPSSIASIDVLKDADATAIYGSRGANGVILITTRKGMGGKTRVEFNAYTGTMRLSQPMKLLSNKDYLSMRHEAFANDGAIPDVSSAADLLVWDTTRSTNWQKTLLGGTGQINDVHSALSGGDSLTHFRVGGGYHRETSIFPGSFSDQKGTGSASLEHRSANHRFHLQLDGSYLAETNHLPGLDLTFSALTLSPDAPPAYDSLGGLNWAHSTWVNPLRYTRTLFQATTDNALANLVLDYQLFSSLQVKVSGGYTRMHFAETSTYPLSSDDPAWGITTSSAIFGTNNTSTWIVEPQLNWSPHIGPGELQATFGSTLQNSSQQTQSLYASGYTNDALLQNVAGASSIILNSAQDLHYRYAAVFARLLYNIHHEWIVDFTGRRDGSSRFGPGRQFANLGAVGAAWIFTQQPYFQEHFKALSFGKIRSSYGVTGNDQIGDYQYLSTYTPTPYPYQNQGGLYPTSLSNPDFGWEKNTKWEAALETGWWKNRLLLTVDYYHNRSSNQLVGSALPIITGFTTVIANLPAVLQNTGWEFELTAKNIVSRSLNWSTSVNLTIPHDKLIAFPDLSSSAYAHTYLLGNSLSVQQLFHLSNVDPATGTYQYVDKNGKQTNSPAYPDDLIARRNMRQQLYGGIANALNYKGWKLDVFIQFVQQTGRNYLTNFPLPGTVSNQPTVVNGRWQKPGDPSSIQRFSQDYGSNAATAYSNIYLSDRAFSDASFVSLKNVALSYSFAPPKMRRYGLHGLKAYVQGQNLYHFDKYLGLNPQTQSFVSLPLLRILTGGIQITI